MIPHRYLQITYRNGRPFAAYLHLPRKLGDKSARSSGTKADWSLTTLLTADQSASN